MSQNRLFIFKYQLNEHSMTIMMLMDGHDHPIDIINLDSTRIGMRFTAKVIKILNNGSCILQLDSNSRGFLKIAGNLHQEDTVKVEIIKDAHDNKDAVVVLCHDFFDEPNYHEKYDYIFDETNHQEKYDYICEESTDSNTETACHEKCGSIDSNYNISFINSYLCKLSVLDYPYEIVTNSSSIKDALLTECILKEVKLYVDDIPFNLFYKIDKSIEDALKPRVLLKNGSNIVIESTEALTVIDINTASSGRVADKEYFYHINKSALAEAAHQIRLRNISGMIIIDLINMNNKAKEAELIQYFKEITCDDYCKVSVIDITSLGLLEITRKRTLKPLSEQLENN